MTDEDIKKELTELLLNNEELNRIFEQSLYNWMNERELYGGLFQRLKLPEQRLPDQRLSPSSIKEFMAQKQQNQTDFTDLGNVKSLILVNEQAHTNWMSGRPLVTGNEAYAKSNPADWARLTKAYEKMNKAMGNPPINTDKCCGGGCGCHGE